MQIDFKKYEDQNTVVSFLKKIEKCVRRKYKMARDKNGVWQLPLFKYLQVECMNMTIFHIVAVGDS